MNWEWASRISVLCFVASYLVGWGSECLRLAWPKITPWPTWVATAAGLFAQTLFLVYRGVEQGRLPTASTFDSLIVLSWITTLLYFYLSINGRRQSIGLFVLPVSIGFAVFAGLLLNQTSTGEAGVRILGTVHGLLLLAGCAAMALAMVASSMYLVKARQLRTGLFLGRLQLPSLERLERLAAHALFTTWPLMTIGIGLGFALRSLPWNDPKVILTIGSWFALTYLVHFRTGPTHRGVPAAWATIIAGCVLLLAVLGDPLLGTSHQLMRGEPQ